MPVRGTQAPFSPNPGAVRSRYRARTRMAISDRPGAAGTGAQPLPSPTALLDSLFEGADFGLALLDADLRFMRLNTAMARINGLRVEDHIGRTAVELLPALPDTATEASRRVLETGVAVHDLEVVAPVREAGPPHTFECSYFPVIEDGGVSGVWTAVREVTEERRAGAAEVRLAGELAEQRVISQEVFARAPAGMLLLWGPELTIRAYNRQLVEDLPARGEISGRRLVDAFPEARELAEGVPEAVLGRGETLHFDDVPLAFGGEGALDGNRHYRFTAVPVPGADGAAAGVLIVGHDTTSAVRRQQALEQELEEEHRIATQLQVSLMPDRLPAVPGADIVSSFRPAGDGHEIGGDFFDVFPMGPECWMLVIGDVCGKGAEAAALTALARYTLRAAAIQEGAEPATLLAQLNEAILRQRADTRFLTVVCAFLEAGENGSGLKITLCVAGHPPPLRVGADGTVTPVGGQGALLGVWEVADLDEEVVHLGVGERLVLYTDGVLEAGAPEAELGEDGLAALLATTGRGSAAATVASIEGAVIARGDASPRDDIAVLVVRPDPETAP